MEEKHRCFISYYHFDDQWYKETLVRWAKANDIFIDGSVDTGDIDDDNLTDEQIREIIRDEYLADTTVTIVLVGPNTKKRKHVDWEIYSSMFDGKKNKKSGIIVIMLPETNCSYVHAAHGEQKTVFPDIENWTSLSEQEYDYRYPFMPKRLLKNIKSGAKISVTTWDRLDSDKFKMMIDDAYNDRASCKYDFSLPMMRKNL